MAFTSNLYFAARVVSLASFPFAWVLSFPYPFTAYHGWKSPTVAPAVGLIVLLFAGWIDFVDLRYGKKLRSWLGIDKHEYRITLGPANDDESKETRRNQVLTILGDTVSTFAIALILGFTMADINYMSQEILVVYAALPYFFAGTSHLILVLLGFVRLVGYKAKPVQCPRCDYIIGQASVSPIPSGGHSPKVTGAGQPDLERQPVMRGAAGTPAA